MLYFVDGSKKTFLSIGAAQRHPTKLPEAGAAALEEEFVTAAITEADDHSPASCGCPVRTPAPDPPKLDIKSYSVEELKQIILKHYRSLTFNTCTHQLPPMMHGLPLKLHVDPATKSHVCHTPAPVPAHWDKQVRADLERDVALGVLERVEPNTPVTWCHRMVLQRKHNGALQQALPIPHGALKSTNDALNGFHSLKLREEDKHYTTFITPYGRFRYEVGVQGWLATGDAYTQRFDKITEDVKQKRQCMTGRNGIILNPDKFQFAQETVDWAGVRVTMDKVEPLPYHIESIKSYPTPTNLTYMISFFALVEQVAPFVMVKPYLLPFRELLKKERKFY